MYVRPSAAGYCGRCAQSTDTGQTRRSSVDDDASFLQPRLAAIVTMRARGGAAEAVHLGESARNAVVEAYEHATNKVQEGAEGELDRKRERERKNYDEQQRETSSVRS